MLRAFTAHNMVLEYTQGESQARAACPFCGRKGKFYASAETGMWDCKVCGESGNLHTFLFRASKVNQEGLFGKALRDLCASRGLSAATLRRWGVGWDGKQYTIPMPSFENAKSLVDLRRYHIGGKSIATPSCKSGVLGARLLQDRTSGVVYIMEGEWDTMAMDECLRANNVSNTPVVGVCGAGVFKPEWSSLFENRNIVMCYDNDDAGVSGTRRTGVILQGVARSISHVAWPKGLKSGYDFRDLYSEWGREALQKISAMRVPFSFSSENAVEQKSEDAPRESKAPTFTGDGISWKEIVDGYQKWLLLKNPDVLAVLFGMVFANRLSGEPLWIFLVAPPGGTKSELLMSLSDCPEIYAATTLTAHSLISGGMGPGGSDPSLLPQLNHKILVITDFTAILGAPIVTRDEIFGTLRSAYDGTAKKPFGSGITRSYKSSFGILAAVTPVIGRYTNEHAMLGERFLRYIIDIPGTIMGSTGVIERALGNLNREERMRAELKATARSALNRGVSENEIPKLDPRCTGRLVAVAQLVSVLRGVVPRDKYTRIVIDTPGHELGTRIAKQIAKLCFGISLVMREKRISDNTLRIACKVARDTIPACVESVVRQMFVRTNAHRGMAKACSAAVCLKCTSRVCCTCSELGMWTGLPNDTVHGILEDLRMLRVVERAKGREGTNMEVRWKLSATVQKLMIKTRMFHEEVSWKKGRERDRVHNEG